MIAVHERRRKVVRRRTPTQIAFVGLPKNVLGATTEMRRFIHILNEWCPIFVGCVNAPEEMGKSWNITGRNALNASAIF